MRVISRRFAAKRLAGTRFDVVRGTPRRGFPFRFLSLLRKGAGERARFLTIPAKHIVEFAVLRQLLGIRRGGCYPVIAFEDCSLPQKNCEKSESIERRRAREFYGAR